MSRSRQRIWAESAPIEVPDMYPQYWTPSMGGIFMRYSYAYKKKCVELYRQGKWPETPDGVKEKRFHDTVRIWVRIEDACGPEALRHKNQNKVWTVEEKYELLSLSRSFGIFGDFEKDFVIGISNRHPSATSSTIITLNPTAKNTVPMLECCPCDISGISSSTTTYSMAPAAKLSR